MFYKFSNNISGSGRTSLGGVFCLIPVLNYEDLFFAIQPIEAVKTNLPCEVTRLSNGYDTNQPTKDMIGIIKDIIGKIKMAFTKTFSKSDSVS